MSNLLVLFEQRNGTLHVKFTSEQELNGGGLGHIPCHIGAGAVYASYEFGDGLQGYTKDTTLSINAQTTENAKFALNSVRTRQNEV